MDPNFVPKPAVVRKPNWLEPLFDSFEQNKSYLSADFNLEIICSKTNLSERQVRSCFFDYYGMSFREWRTSMRICEAKRLIKEDKKISDIYLELGFKDKSNFHRQFVRHTGMTPLQWRDL